ncbi:phosphoglycerate mutase [Ectocarpus siliculosus]|uniref:phosphoglycerate mutase (2,3-diphosphoglycerate-dependent) n=1 Tax=Ectocarpus siliculosus TaxID=2880 RepID=D7FIM7_ECTSI|nr:phosphoglycerate mutase [Ectocarpus siliculosus]|eukprot:CBJ28845.1 phosphoglycerate mutase [Ectocarpus siliculosus]
MVTTTDRDHHHLPAPQETTTSHRVVFLRHGESTWNRDDRHIGWTDVPLTEKGEHEALLAGRALRKEGFEFDVVFASVLKRVLKTEHIVMDELDQLWVPEIKDYRLNERHYGDCIGKTKPEAEEAFGKENVALWASSYDVAPHPMSTDGLYYPKDDRRYQHVVDEDGACAIPRTECMKDVSRRVVGYWEEEIAPVVRSGKRVLVAGHANMLKTLLQHLDGIPDDVIVTMKVPRATPIVYDLGADMKPLRSPLPDTLLSAELLSVDGAPARMAAADGEVNAF